MVRSAGLILLILLHTFICTSHSARCCLRYSKRPIRCKLLQGYSHQHITASCDISAIVFRWRGGADRFVCADPSQPWTQQCVEKLREKMKKQHNGTSRNVLEQV
ncbi:C-C motif chemokine 20b [Cynoglossus semilaevis]|uniref:C-C motif chemokine 20b n=1 Tax=Cynoglossus semilaevis TaxID=244447 RepID=UPI0004985FAC|nr:C-C motif chemokine 20-like [Cynoglossus semilaevis]